MKDPQKGEVSVTMALCKILAQSAWGRMMMKKISKDKEELQWTLCHDQLSYKIRPENKEGEEDLPLLCSYWQHLQEVFPSVSENEVEDPVERERTNMEANTQIKNKLLIFGQKGSPGAKFASQFSKMLKNLILPSAARQHCNIPDDALTAITVSKVESQSALQTEGEDRRSMPDPSERRETTALSQRGDAVEDGGVALFDDGRSAEERW
jgi:hypothetical protein